MKKLFFISLWILLSSNSSFGTSYIKLTPELVDSAFQKVYREIDSLEKSNKNLKWRLDSLEIVKGQRELLLNAAQERFDNALTTLEIIIGFAAIFIAIISAIVGWAFKGAVARFDGNVRQLETERHILNESADALGRLNLEALNLISRLEDREKVIRESADKIMRELPTLEQAIQKTEAERQTLKENVENYERRIAFLEEIGAEVSVKELESLYVSRYVAKDFLGALDTIKKLMKINPNDERYAESAAVVLLNLNRPDDALVEIAKLDKNNSGGIYNKACAYAQKREKQLAMKHLDEAITLESKYRTMAQSDLDFEFYRNDPDFRKLVGLPPLEEGGSPK